MPEETRVSQFVVEYARNLSAEMRVSQFVIEYIRGSVGPPAPPFVPTPFACPVPEPAPAVPEDGCKIPNTF